MKYARKPEVSTHKMGSEASCLEDVLIAAFVVIGIATVILIIVGGLKG